VAHGAGLQGHCWCARTGGGGGRLPPPRLAGEGGLEYGTLPAGSDFEAIIARARPAL
jgi:hypothetical protein